MKARIIYKEGREGENVLDAIVGIAVPMPAGHELVVYPKYKECALLEGENVAKLETPYASPADRRILGDHLFRTITDDFERAGSPAAKFVREQGDYSLPGPLAADAIYTFGRYIDEKAYSIEGADRLDRPYLFIWSCLRCDANTAWASYDGYGQMDHYNCCYDFLAVPVLVIKSRP